MSLVRRLTRPVEVPRFVWHLGHASQALALTAVLREWAGLSLLVATALGASVFAASIEAIQHVIEGTEGPRLRDRVADWWDYQLAWLVFAGSAGLVPGLGFGLVWLGGYIATLSWRRP